MPDFLRLLVASVVGAVVALGLAYWLLPANPGGADTVGTSDRSPISVENTSFEQDVRLANIELDLKRVNETLDQLRAGASLFGTSFEADPTETGQAPTPAAVPGARSAGVPIVASAEVLTAAGLPADQASVMVERLDELALARLNAEFEVRQNRGSDAEQVLQAREARRAIPRDSEAIRGEFGDEAFDKYLYALDQPNRVAVTSVLQASSAESAGLESGDFLRTLDGEALFSVRDLTRRIRQGSPDRTYSLVVERNGQQIETFVPGGPLGVRVGGASVQPDQ